MLLRRLKIASLFAVAAMVCNSADACWLTDWLYGRTASPYAAGYAPYSAGYAPYSAGYAPVSAGYAPYSAGYAPYSSGYAPYANTTVLPLSTPATTSGVFQVQRPSYLENPSVYTGAPVGTNLQTAYSVPVTSPQLFRTNPSLLGSGPTSSYLGAANTYPGYASGYRGTYSANFPAVPTGTPATALPATQVAPLFPNAPAPAPAFRGGLARFFGNLFGTNYRTSYYRAPVTYYRPATSVDPISGTTVTVQQPCTSTVQQLQRTPFNGLQSNQPTITPIGGLTPATGPISSGPISSGPISSGPISSGPSPSAYGYAPSTGIGQASAMTTPGFGNNQFTVPIPSTMSPAGGFSGMANPNAAPLTGNPSSPQIQSDLSPVEQPSLRRVPVEKDYEADLYTQPRYESESRFNRKLETQPRQTQPRQPESDVSPYGGYWEEPDADDTTAMLPKRDRQPPSFVNNHPIRALQANERDNRDRFEASPFRSDLMRRDADRRTDSRDFVAPPLPPRQENWREETTSVGNSRSGVQQAAWIPVREASAKKRPATRFVPRTNSVQNVNDKQERRDNTWSSAR